MTRTPSPTRFVVRGTSKEKLRERLGPDIRHEIVDAKLVVVVVEPDAPEPDPRQTSRKLQERLGADVFVAPVLVDDRGGAAYPTGRIQVRFDKPPSDQRCLAFAESHELKFLSRNKYQSAQCLFKPLDVSAYLPDVVEDLASAEGVRRVWEVTEGQYTRG